MSGGECVKKRVETEKNREKYQLRTVSSRTESHTAGRVSRVDSSSTGRELIISKDTDCKVGARGLAVRASKLSGRAV